MNIEEFREYCLSLGEVTEKTPFGKFAARFDPVLVFYVCGHMFCMVDMDNFTYTVVKNTPEKIAELHETRNSVERQRNMMVKYWIQLNFGGDVSDWVYDPAVGDPDGGIAPGTKFEDLPDDWVCPICGVGKDQFKKVD